MINDKARWGRTVMVFEYFFVCKYIRLRDTGKRFRVIRWRGRKRKKKRVREGERFNEFLITVSFLYKKRKIKKNTKDCTYWWQILLRRNKKIRSYEVGGGRGVGKLCKICRKAGFRCQEWIEMRRYEGNGNGETKW